MFGLEPGDEMRLRLAADFAKPHESMHLVLVAPDSLGHRLQFSDVGIDRDVDQIGIVAQPPQQTIEQGEAFGIAMQDRSFGEFDEFGRNVERAFCSVG